MPGQLGHASCDDHRMGVPGLIVRLGRGCLPPVPHPEAHLEKVILPNRNEGDLPRWRRVDPWREQIEIVEDDGVATSFVLSFVL
jgi:hypothetical protein